jgi:hypothetical protein
MSGGFIRHMSGGFIRHMSGGFIRHFSGGIAHFKFFKLIYITIQLNF